jgi:hypothetical protein
MFANQNAIAAAVFALAVVVGPSATAAQPERPLRGSCATVVTPLTEPGVFPQELRIDLDCTLTHLGRTTGVALQTVTPTGQTGAIVTANIENATTYTAANGDELSQSFVGTALINVQTGEVRFIGTETFDGGTGRFAHASGTSELEGTASIFTNVGFYTTKGRLAY